MPTRKPLPQLHSWLQNPMLSLHLQPLSSASIVSSWPDCATVFLASESSAVSPPADSSKLFLSRASILSTWSDCATVFVASESSAVSPPADSPKLFLSRASISSTWPDCAYSQAASSAEASSSADSFSCTTARTHPHRSIYNNLKKLSLTTSKK